MARDRLFRGTVHSSVKQNYKKCSYFAQAILEHSGYVFWRGKTILNKPAIRRFLPKSGQMMLVLEGCTNTYAKNTVCTYTSQSIVCNLRVKGELQYYVYYITSTHHTHHYVYQLVMRSYAVKFVAL